jgi:hypothetical protein
MDDGRWLRGDGKGEEEKIIKDIHLCGKVRRKKSLLKIG